MLQGQLARLNTIEHVNCYRSPASKLVRELRVLPVSLPFN